MQAREQQHKGQSKAVTALGWGQMYSWVLKSGHFRLIHKCGRPCLLKSGCSGPFLHHLVKAEGPVQALTELQLQAMLYKPARGCAGRRGGDSKRHGQKPRLKDRDVSRAGSLQIHPDGAASCFWMLVGGTDLAPLITQPEKPSLHHHPTVSGESRSL